MGYHRASALCTPGASYETQKVTAITEFTTNRCRRDQRGKGDQCVFLLDLMLAGLFALMLYFVVIQRHQRSSQPAFSLAAFFSSIIFCFATCFSWFFVNCGAPSTASPGWWGVSSFSWGFLEFGLAFHSRGRTFMDSSITSSVTFDRRS